MHNILLRYFFYLPTTVEKNLKHFFGVFLYFPWGGSVFTSLCHPPPRVGIVFPQTGRRL